MLFLMFEKVRERGGKLLRFPHTAEVTQKYLFKNLSCFKLWECQAGWIGGSNLIQQQQDLEGLLKHRLLDSVPRWSPIIPNMFPGDADAVGPALRTTGLEKAWRASQPRIDLLSIKTELLWHFCNSDAMSGTLVKKESWGAMSPLDHLPPSHCPPPLPQAGAELFHFWGEFGFVVLVTWALVWKRSVFDVHRVSLDNPCTWQWDLWKEAIRMSRDALS